MGTAFISGHLDLTEDEFVAHYMPLLDKALQCGDEFVIGDARGTDERCQIYLAVRTKHVKVYHMFTSPRNNAGFETVGGFKSDKERDEAMTAASDYDIAWVRPGRESSGTARNLARRRIL